MSKTRALCVGLLLGAVMLGSGCKTMATRDSSSVQTPAFGGAGLDPNPDHNIPNSPTSVESSSSSLREPLPEALPTNPGQ